MIEHAVITSRKNDGRWSQYSAEQDALVDAFASFYEAGHSEWDSLTIQKLECDDREGHYPDLCWHFRVTIRCGE